MFWSERGKAAVSTLTTLGICSASFAIVAGYFSVVPLVTGRDHQVVSQMLGNDSHIAATPPASQPKRSAVVSRPASIPIDPAPDAAIPPVENGLAPVISTIPTKQPVVFLGIDDGGNKEPFELQLLIQHHIKASLFLANLFMGDDAAFFAPFTKHHMLIEDHTVHHDDMTLLSYEQQRQEICDEADIQLHDYGRRPILFRPPGGSYNVDTQRAAAACGMKAVVLWIAKANGGSMQYQIGDHLNPGDIVLMHFRPVFRDDLQAFLDAQRAAGLHTELLEDWLPKN